jgi:hypothetical protein
MGSTFNTFGKQLLATLGSVVAAQAINQSTTWSSSNGLNAWWRSPPKSKALQNLGLVCAGVAMGVGSTLFLVSDEGKQVRERLTAKLDNLKRSATPVARLAEAAVPNQEATQAANPRARSKKPGKAKAHAGSQPGTRSR